MALIKTPKDLKDEKKRQSNRYYSIRDFIKSLYRDLIKEYEEDKSRLSSPWRGFVLLYSKDDINSELTSLKNKAEAFLSWNKNKDDEYAEVKWLSDYLNTFLILVSEDSDSMQYEMIDYSPEKTMEIVTTIYSHFFEDKN